MGRQQHEQQEQQPAASGGPSADDRPAGSDGEPLARCVRAVADGLGRLATASARRHGEQLVALAVGANALGLERLVTLSAEPGSAPLLEADHQVGELLWVNRTDPPAPAGLDSYGPAFDQAVTALTQSGGPDAVAIASELVSAVNELYGTGLARAFELLDAAGRGEVIGAALDDDVVATALVVHGLHPLDPAERAQRALDAVSTTLPANGPQVELTGSDDEGRLVLTVSGEPARDRWRVAVTAQRAVEAVTPDAAGVVLVGAGPEPANASLGTDLPGGSDSPVGVEVFIPLTAVGRKGRERSHAPRWIEVAALAALPPGEPTRIVADDLRLLACRVGSDLYVTPDPFPAPGPARENGSATGPAPELALILQPTTPPSVTDADGRTFSFDQPLTVSIDGDRYEVLVP